jgi:hypothetical protein
LKKPFWSGNFYKNPLIIEQSCIKGENVSRSIALLLVFVFFIASYLVVFSPVKAEAQRKNVPSDYPTIASALENANDGDTIFVRKGTYEENTLVINKSISLVGEGAANTIISLHPPWVQTGGYHLGNGTVEPDYGYDNPIKITANSVKISGFSIISEPSRLIRVTGNGIQITGNYIATGLFLESVGQNVAGNIIKGEITCIGSNHTIAKNILDGVWNGADGVLVEGNIISGEYGIAIGAWGNTVVNNTIENNKRAFSFWTWASKNAIYHNNFINNTEVLSTWELGNQTVGTWDGGFPYGGDYWSDYLLKYPDAREINGTGLGDTPYAIDSYNQDNYPLMSPINIPISANLPQLETLTISIMSPEGRTYSVNNLSLTFTLNELTEWIGYSIDNQDNITIYGNTTLPSLSDGQHNLTVSARDIFGNTGTSETVSFGVEVPKPFPFVPVVVASVASATIIGAGILFYFKKRNYVRINKHSEIEQAST